MQNMNIPFCQEITWFNVSEILPSHPPNTKQIIREKPLPIIRLNQVDKKLHSLYFGRLDLQQIPTWRLALRLSKTFSQSSLALCSILQHHHSMSSTDLLLLLPFVIIALKALRKPS